MSSPRTLIVASVIGAVLLAGCGSSASTKTASSPTSTAATSTAPTSTAPTGSGPTTSRVPASGSRGLPAVSGATDLDKEPGVAKGTAPAPATLETRDLVVGKGKVAVASDTVKVQYVGALYSNGKVFDASWTDSGPATFPLGQVVPGFRDAIVGMHVGGRREVVIPPALGYGAAGSPPVIPADATLVFVIDLLAIS